MLVFTFICMITEADPRTTLISWKYLDRIIPPTPVQLPTFDQWISSDESKKYDRGAFFIPLNEEENATTSTILDFDTRVPFTVLYFNCSSEIDEIIQEAKCHFELINQTISLSLGEEMNFTSPVDLKHQPLKITLQNTKNTIVNFLYPQVAAYRNPYYTDINIISQLPVEDQMKATLCMAALNESYGKIEIHTIHLSPPHEIPSIFYPLNNQFKSQSQQFEYASIPILSSETRILGMNIFDSTLKFWQVYVDDENDAIGFSMQVNVVYEFIVSYFLIETSSNQYTDALEIWNNVFYSIYSLDEDLFGAIATPSQTNSYCVTSFNQKFMWGNQTINGFPRMINYLPIEPFSIEISVHPNDIISCSQNPEDENYSLCKNIVDYGLMRRPGRFSYSETTTGYKYDIIWTVNATDNYQSLINEYQQYGYSGFAFDFSLAYAMNYNNNNNTQYMLIDNQNNEFLPTLSSFFTLSISLMSASKHGDIYLTEYFHPQFIYLTATVAIEINLIKSSSFYYGTEQHSKLWQMRGHLGSKPFTALISSDLTYFLQYFENFVSICFVVGAFPSFYFPTWSDCRFHTQLIAYFNEWTHIYQTVFQNTIYFANNNALVSISIDPELQFPPLPNKTETITAKTLNQKQFDINHPKNFIQNKQILDQISHELNKKKSKYFKLKKAVRISDDIYEEDEDVEVYNTFGTIDNDGCFYEATTYCQDPDDQIDGVIDCFTNILLAVNNTGAQEDDTIVRTLDATFITEQSPTCYKVVDPLQCSVHDRTVRITFKEDYSSEIDQIYRLAVIRFKYRIDISFEDWVRENLAAIIGSLICILFLFIAMGFGIWCMYCRKRSNNMELARIMNEEKKFRKMKQKKMKKMRDEQLQKERNKNDSDFSVESEFSTSGEKS